MHVAICTATTLDVLWLSGASRSLTWHLNAGVALLVSHWLIDSRDGARRWMQLYHQSRLESVRTGVDQSSHLLWPWR